MFLSDVHCVQALHSFEFPFFLFLLYNDIPGMFGVGFWVWGFGFGVLL